MKHKCYFRVVLFRVTYLFYNGKSLTDVRSFDKLYNKQYFPYVGTLYDSLPRTDLTGLCINESWIYVRKSALLFLT